MTDKELLELAAKAAGYRIIDIDGSFYEPGEPTMQQWNPLTDDGDALRLAVKLGLFVAVDQDATGAQKLNSCFVSEVHGADPYAATRRAIVRAAAEIGKTLKD